MTMKRRQSGRAIAAKLLRETRCTRCKCIQPLTTRSVTHPRSGRLMVICGDCGKKR